MAATVGNNGTNQLRKISRKIEKWSDIISQLNIDVSKGKKEHLSTNFNECRSTLRMTTGSAGLDSLIDSIHEGQFYLFYGKNTAILDGLIHGLLSTLCSQ